VIVAISFAIFFVAESTVRHWVDPQAFYLHIGILDIPWMLLLILPYMASAFVVHLWLPLFALSSLVVRLIYLLFRALEWAEWFLKQGDAHPLKAIGIVATVIVFGSAMLVKEGWALL
jgi:hypothetical protein